MTQQYSIDDKHALYTLVMKHGFDLLQKPELLESVAPGIKFSELKTFFDLYRNNTDENQATKWAAEIINQKQHYKHEPFYNLMSEIMEKKANTLEDDDPYRNVYQFLGTVLRGEIPENASSHTTMVVLLLMEDMNRLIQDVKPDQLQACLTAAPGDTDNSPEDEELKQRLLSLFKFQRINEFINPLGVSSKASEKVHERIFKS